MCDPGTIAVLYGIGTGINMYSQRGQGKFQKDMMGYQSDLERNRAALAQENAEIQAGRLAGQRRQETAAGMTGFAANGMLLDGDPESAPNVWEQDMAAETAWRREELRSNAMYEAWGHSANASMLTAQGGMARRGATLSMWGAAFTGAAQAGMLALTPSGGGGNAPKTSANYAGASGTHGGSVMTAYA
jgi:hypothetical protein